MRRLQLLRLLQVGGVFGRRTLAHLSWSGVAAPSNRVRGIQRRRLVSESSARRQDAAPRRAFCSSAVSDKPRVPGGGDGARHHSVPRGSREGGGLLAGTEVWQPDPLHSEPIWKNTQVMPGVLISPFNSTLKYPLFCRDLNLSFCIGS